jgi:hypothetical protein
MSQGSQLDGGRELEQLRQKDPLTGAFLQRMIDAINRLGTNAGVAAMGEAAAPDPVDSISVKGTLNQTTNTLTAPSEMLHWVHTHNVPLKRGIQYVTEIDTDPNFPNPHPIDHGSSRSGFMNLPANGDDTTATSYYLRVTPQYPGSPPGKPTVFGGKTGPTKILLTGTTNMSLLSSQSGGTARPGQGAKGLGPVKARDPVGGPKRAFNQDFGTK